MNSTYLLLSVSLIAFNSVVQANEPVKKDPIQSEVVVTKSYTPTLDNRIQKIPYEARIPDSMRIKPKITFSPTRILPMPGHFNPKPLDVFFYSSENEPQNPTPVWDISAGLGSLIDPFLHLQGTGTDAVAGQWHLSALHASTHRSITRFNGLKSPNHQSNTALEGSSEWKIRQKYIVQAQIGYQHLYHSLYGYSDAHPTLVPYQSAHLFHAWAEGENITQKQTDWRFRMNLYTHLWTDAYDNQELAWKLNGSVEKERPQGDRMGMNVRWEVLSQSLLPGTDQNVILEIHPYYARKIDRFWISGALRLVYDNRSESHFFPYLNARISYDALEDEIACPFLAIEGEHQTNRLSDWNKINPYLEPNHSHPENTDYRFGARLGVEGKMGGIFSYQVSQAYKKINNAAFFLNYPSDLGSSEAFFALRFDDIHLMETLLKAEYQILPDLSADGRLCYRAYYMDKLALAYQVPAVEGHLALAYNLWKKVRLRLSGQYRGDFYGNEADASLTKVSVPASFNLSFQGVYQWHDRSRIWLNMDNLLNQHLHRFYRYNDYGFHLQLGIGFRF